MKMTLRQEFYVVAAFVIALGGCSGTGSPFDSVPVSGKVTYEDGSPIPVSGMTLYFFCQEPPQKGMHPRPASVGVGPDGTFSNVTTYKYADGLVLGKHKVAIVCSEHGKPSPKIPKGYDVATKTPLTVEVTHSGQELEIKVPKP
jgi:hypothetical protein